MANNRSGRWCIFVIFVILGTFLGVFLSRFDMLAKYFKNVVDVGFDTGSLDLLFMNLRLACSFKINLGTFVGALVGIWFLR
ncbi:DUF4321 domain-containing protein [Thermovirga sp.]|uniref:DUF4321 domain-containing protein n=1 Tax=Thermovirga sp. TaxID=2699834 RepID=UPI0025DAA425|nr:DUF4321 domain-containing protein [Thermovirga sp.]MBO8153477.1 DUF4321 domain-containing protein [Thermovirga sp.]